MPKVVLCAAQLVQLVTMRMYVYVQLEQDPFFDAVSEHHMNTTYETIHFFGTFLGLVYMMYFGVLTYAAFQQVNPEHDNHRYATAATLITMSSSCILMIFNGQVSQRMEPSLFMSLYLLFNLYLWFTAYLYAPSLDFSATGSKNPRAKGANVSEAEKER